jgi:ATP-dependent metalloprotease
MDKAVLRSGRFDKIIKVPLPDVKGRLEIINYYLSKVTTEKIITSKYDLKGK